MTGPAASTSESIFRKRLRKFRRIKRGYWSFLFILVAYVVSFFLPYLANDKALAVRYEDQYYFPMMRFYEASQFDQDVVGEPDYRSLRAQFATTGESDWVLMPLYPYGPYESLLDLPGFPPHPPSAEHLFGTDNRGRDVLVRLAYGFNISLTFAILVTFISYTAGIMIGACLGYIGGKFDLLGQRTIEVWGIAAVPLHDHLYQLDRRAGLHPGPDAGPAAILLAPDLDPRGVRVDGHDLLRPRRVLS